jgi:hypothetical protein
MGRVYAEGIAETELPLATQIEWHLKSNHFPPVPEFMVKPCIEAINAANAGEWNKNISLPDGVGYRGLTIAPVSAMIEQHHLDAWITNEGEY